MNTDLVCESNDKTALKKELKDVQQSLEKSGKASLLAAQMYLDLTKRLSKIEKIICETE